MSGARGSGNFWIVIVRRVRRPHGETKLFCPLALPTCSQAGERTVGLKGIELPMPTISEYTDETKYHRGFEQQSWAGRAGENQRTTEPE
jgi:hypothetical protein